jgi:uncharacterized protein (TIGR03067 family)
MRTIAGLAWLIAGAALAADGPADEVKKFDGAWVFESVLRNGKADPIDDYKDVRVVFKGGSFTLFKGDKELAAGTFTLPPGQTPAAIDTTMTSGPDKGKSEKGIYKFDGDKLTLCFGEGDKAPRPKAFESKEGDKTELSVLKRAK